MKFKILLLMFLSCFCFIHSQNLDIKNDKLSFFELDYEYLDEQFKINITNKNFQELTNKYNFYNERINSYDDSLAVILTHNFKGDWAKTNRARFILSYSWKRLSYHLWLSEIDVKIIAGKIKINHPYIFKQYLLNNKNSYTDKIFNDLIKKLKESSLDVGNIKEMSRNDIMSFAMRHNKIRILDYQRDVYKQNHGEYPNENSELGISCGKENCCQTIKK